MKKMITLAVVLGVTLNCFAQKAGSTQTPKITLHSLSAENEGPLIVIDGNKQYAKGMLSLNGIDQNNIESINIWKDSAAVSKYGPDGFGGVIEIKTKNSKTNSIKGTSRFKNLADSNPKAKISGLRLRPKTPLNTEPSKLRNLLFRDFDPKARPIFVLDGKEIAEIDNLSPNSIESVNVLKAANGIAQYGDKGKNGVVIITTKKAKVQQKNK